MKFLHKLEAEGTKNLSNSSQKNASIPLRYFLVMAFLDKPELKRSLQREFVARAQANHLIFQMLHPPEEIGIDLANIVENFH